MPSFTRRSHGSVSKQTSLFGPMLSTVIESTRPAPSTVSQPSSRTFVSSPCVIRRSLWRWVNKYQPMMIATTTATVPTAIMICLRIIFPLTQSNHRRYHKGQGKSNLARAKAIGE